MNTRKRRQNFQNIAWFLDLLNRDRLDMDPPFQRRSVWNDSHRQDFIDTILLDYPAPAIFLFTTIAESGATTFQLVDGKQRLTSVFGFIGNKFPVGERSPIERLRGKYFESLSKEEKVAFYEYDFSIEYLPTNDEQIINGIFERLNRNVFKLTPQELRHARFSGRFITQVEALQEWMGGLLGKQLPRITESSRRQMKDVEVVATLLLFLEEGAKGYSTLTLDKAFSDRDEEWDRENEIVEEFRTIILWISRLAIHPDGAILTQSRLRNQADFYSLFAAIAELTREQAFPDDPTLILVRLKGFLSIVDDEASRANSKDAAAYYDAARSASNDPGPRQVRIDVMKKVLRGLPVG